MRSSLLFKGALVALFLCQAIVPAAAETRKPMQSSTLTITSAGGATHHLEVEIAANEADRRYGLMNRKTMPADHGMLFVFPQPRYVMMWMKDTLLPLDMLFVDETGRVTHIKRDAHPMDLTIIPAEGMVNRVIEVNAGYVAREKIAEGDRVDGPAMALTASE